jgi:hypothetical protein
MEIPPVPSHNWKFFMGFIVGLITAFIIMIIIANTVPASQPPPPPPPPPPVTPQTPIVAPTVSGYS